MSSKKLDNLVPPFLDQKAKSRKNVRSAEGFIVAAYENCGSLSVFLLPTKKPLRVDISSPQIIKNIDARGSYVAAVCVDPRDKQNSIVALYNPNTETLITQKFKQICEKATKIGGAPASAAPSNDGGFPFGGDDDGAFPFGGDGPADAPGVNVPEILQVYCAIECAVFVCPDCLFVLPFDKFAEGAATRVEPAAGPTPNSKAPAILNSALQKFSRVLERKNQRWISLMGNRELQLWDLNTGNCLIHGKPHEPTKTSRFIVKTFMLSYAELVDPVISPYPVVIASSVDQIYSFFVGRDPVIVEQKVCPSCIMIAGPTIVAGNMDGLISVFDVISGQKLRDLNITTIDPTKPRGIITQMRSRVNCLEHFDNIILSGFEDGDVCVWDFEREEQEEAMKHHEYKDCSVKDFVRTQLGNSEGVYVNHVKKTDKTEEVTKVDFDWKRIKKKVNSRHASSSRGSSPRVKSPQATSPTLGGIAADRPDGLLAAASALKGN